MTKLDELIQQLCPDGVKYYTLNTICNVYDGTHQTPQYTDSGIKFASVENIADPYATEKYISVSDYEKYKIKPQRNDLLKFSFDYRIISTSDQVARAFHFPNAMNI